MKKKEIKRTKFKSRAVRAMKTEQEKPTRQRNKRSSETKEKFCLSTGRTAKAKRRDS